jgi:hypothetical protein
MNRKALVAAGLLAIAEIVGAAEPVRQTFECDTLPGHFSFWNRTVTSAPIGITGRLIVNELRKDKKWSPVAQVVLLGGEDGKARFALHLTSFSKTPEFFFLNLDTPSGKTKLGLGIIPSTEKTVDFSMRLDAGGQLEVSLAGNKTSVAVGAFKPAKLELSCSTGDFEFSDFVIEAP